MERRCFFFIATVVFVSLSRAVTVDPPQKISVEKLDKTPVNGLVTAIDDTGLDVMDAQKQTTHVSIDELPPAVTIGWYERLVLKGTAEQWFGLGKKLIAMPNGRAPAERAWRKAIALDPTYKDKVVAARKEAASAATKPSAKPSTTPMLRAPDGTPIDVNAPATKRSPFDPKDPNKKIIGPQQVGQNDPTAWQKQSAEQQIENVKALKAFAEQAKQITPALQERETGFFLFYSDLTPAEAQKWQLMLDRMYARLAQLFGIEPTENIWHGKALVFVFAREEDYLKFEVKLHNTVAAGTAGMCHTFGTGDVHIAFYRQPNDLDFAHVLVHESLHGFLHRYRSPGVVPSWANEGLAETIAMDMVPQRGIMMSATADARADLQAKHSLEKMLDAEHIVAWQYPVSRTLTEFMIKQNKKGFVDFINGIKDGMKWDEALKTKYGVPPDQLIAAYGQSMGVAGLKP